MQSTTENWSGRLPLMVAHCAGMVDLVALPVWVGALIAQYRFAPQQAGGLATLFLIGAVLSSLFFAPRLNRMNVRLAVIGGFAFKTVLLLFVLPAALVAFGFDAPSSRGEPQG